MIKADRSSSTSHLLKIVRCNKWLRKDTFENKLRAKAKSVKDFLQTRLNTLSLRIGRPGCFLESIDDDAPIPQAAVLVLLHLPHCIRLSCVGLTTRREQKEHTS